MGESGVLNDSPTDLSPIMSTFMSSNGIRYHLHPELVQEGEGEVISVCVDCLQLIKEEDDAGTIHLDSPDAEVKTEKRNGGSQKLREKTMEEADAGKVHLDSPDAEVKTEKRNGASQKLRENSMAIAAGCDYGVLSR